MEFTWYFGEKSYFLSIKKRFMGNRLFNIEQSKSSSKQKTNALLLSLYTKSVAFAIDNSEELARAYVCRSNILRILGKREESLIDFFKATAISFPNDTKFKKQLVEHENFYYSKTDDNDASDKVKTNTSSKVNPSETISRTTSDLVSITFDEKYGKHVVANQDIEPGTIISMEKGFLFPKKHKMFLNCSHCLNLIWNVVTCENCTLIYCSEKCKEEAWSSYHDYECLALPCFSVYSTNSELRSLAYIIARRILIQSIKEEGLQNILEQARVIDNGNSEYFE